VGGLVWTHLEKKKRKKTKLSDARGGKLELGTRTASRRLKKRNSNEDTTRGGKRSGIRSSGKTLKGSGLTVKSEIGRHLHKVERPVSNLMDYEGLGS